MNDAIARFMLILSLASAPAYATMSLTSTDLVAGYPIPNAQIYPRCGGRNISPQLSWTGAPAGTRRILAAGQSQGDCKQFRGRSLRRTLSAERHGRTSLRIYNLGVADRDDCFGVGR